MVTQRNSTVQPIKRDPAIASIVQRCCLYSYHVWIDIARFPSPNEMASLGASARRASAFLIRPHFRLYSSTPIVTGSKRLESLESASRPKKQYDRSSHGKLGSSSTTGPVRSSRNDNGRVRDERTEYDDPARTKDHHSRPTLPRTSSFGLRKAPAEAPGAIDLAQSPTKQHTWTDTTSGNEFLETSRWPTRSSTPPKQYRTNEPSSSPASARPASRPQLRSHRRKLEDSQASEHQPVAPQSSPTAKPTASTESPGSARTSMPWRPAKKLTYQAMAGLRALHANDPKTFSKDALSERFGISYEAVNRILRSKYQDKKGGGVAEKLQGTKWDLDPRTSSTSPVPAVKRAFAQRPSTRTDR